MTREEGDWESEEEEDEEGDRGESGIRPLLASGWGVPSRPPPPTPPPIVDADLLPRHAEMGGGV